MLNIKRTEENCKVSKKEHFFNSYPDATGSGKRPVGHDNPGDYSLAKKMFTDLQIRVRIDEQLTEIFGNGWTLNVLWQKIQMVFWIVGFYFSVRFLFFLIFFFNKTLKPGGPIDLLKTTGETTQ